MHAQLDSSPVISWHRILLLCLKNVCFHSMLWLSVPLHCGALIWQYNLIYFRTHPDVFCSHYILYRQLYFTIYYYFIFYNETIYNTQL